MIDFELYKIFKIVADEKNITKASEKLHISQPAVTKHIKNLELELGVQLFNRSNNGMSLTVDGQKLYDKINVSIINLTEAEQVLKDDKIINLGVHVNMPTEIYNNAILEFYKEKKKVVINIHKLDAVSMDKMIQNGKVDIVFSKKYSDELFNSNDIIFNKIGYLHDEFIVRYNSKYINKQYTLEELKKIPIYTLKKFSSAYQSLISLFNYNKNEKTNIENINFQGMIELLSVRDVVTVMTKEYVENELLNKKLRVLDTGFKLLESEYGIYYKENKNDKEILNLIKKLINNCKA